MESEVRISLVRFHFTIRRFLVLIVVTGVICAWAGRLIMQGRAHRNIVAQLAADGATAHYGYELVGRPRPSFLNRIQGSMFGNDAVSDIESIDFGSAPQDRDLKLMLTLPELKTLSFYGLGFTDGALSYVARVHGLNELALVETSVTPMGLCQLSVASNLTTLFLSGKSFTDEHAKCTGTLRTLRYLRLDDTSIGNVGMQYIGSISELRGLGLYRNGLIESSGFEQLSKLRTLETLSVIDTVKHNSDLRSISVILGLRELRLWSNQVDDGVVDYIIPLKKLTLLDLHEAQIGDVGIARIASLPAIEVLMLDGTKVGDAAIVSLLSMRHLRRLDIKATKVSDAGLKKLEGLPSLIELRLSVGQGITPQGVQHFKDARPSCNVIYD